MSLINLFFCFLLVVIISNTLKFFHCGYARFYKLNTCLLKGYHSLVLYGVFLHLFCRCICSYHLTHIFIDNQDFMNSRTTKVTCAMTMDASDCNLCIRDIVAYERFLSRCKGFCASAVRTDLTHKALRYNACESGRQEVRFRTHIDKSYDRGSRIIGVKC